MLLDVLTAEQLFEWEAYNRLQPISRERWDFYFAYILMTINNLTIAVHGKKGAKQFKFEDFYPKWAGDFAKAEPEAMSVQDMKEFWKSFAATHNKQVKRNLKVDSRKPKNLAK
jgi:hypothetical protein